VTTSRRLSTIIDQSPNSGVLIVVVEASVDVLSVDDVFEDDVLVVVPVLNVEEVLVVLDDEVLVVVLVLNVEELLVVVVVVVVVWTTRKVVCASASW
jgi:hypothetical protein